MRRSTQVAAPLLAFAAAAMLSGCRKPEMQRCVDEHNVVVDDSYCRVQSGQQQSQQQGQQDNSYYHGSGGGFYRYYYGGFGGYTPGSAVIGGGFSPAVGHSYASPTVRGGFGSSFSGGGFGAGE